MRTSLMRRGFMQGTLVLACTASLPLHARTPRPARNEAPRVTIRHVHADRVFLDGGTDEGLAPGVNLDVARGTEKLGTLTVTSAGSHRAVATWKGTTPHPLQGDTVRAPPSAGTAPMDTKRPAVEPALRARAATPWQRPPYTDIKRVEFHGITRVPHRVRAQAYLLADAWFSSGGAPSAVARTRLQFRVDTPLDPEDRLHATFHGQVVLQPWQSPGSVVEPHRVAWMEWYQGTLTWRTRHVELGAGRSHAPILRYGWVDGVFASWHLGDELHVRAGVGQRPDVVNFLPNVFRPAATLTAEGRYRWRLLGLSYGWGTALVGRGDAGVDGVETAARAQLQVGDMSWWDADVAGVAWVTRSLRPEVTLERMGTSAWLREGPLTARVSARRQASAALPAEKLLLPPGYLYGMPWYDVAASVDATGGTRSLQGTISGTLGAAFDGTHAADRVYFTPELGGRLPRFFNVSARAGSRSEVGPTSAQFATLHVSAEPLENLRLNTWHHAGTWILLDARQVLPSWAWHVGAEYRFLRALVVGMRGRGQLGLAGRTMEVSAFVGADRW